jgi:short-subunit dehydrogenase
MVTFPIGPGTRAIVTGASWGIGETFAQMLAARGVDLLLVARTEDRLRAVADRLRERYGVRVETVTVDLAQPDGPSQIVEAADRLGFEPTMLVNNAGVGVLGPFADLPVEKAREMVRLNVLAVANLTYRLLERMEARGHGTIVNVASASGFQPLPNYAVYAASKSFVISFTSAIWAEARGKGVRIIAVCPGPVDAGAPESPSGVAHANSAAATPRRRSLRRRVTREQVVQETFNGLARNQSVVIPGGPPAVARMMLGLLPPRYRLRLTGLLMRRYPTMLTGTRRRDPLPQTAPEARSDAISSAV